MKTYQLLGLKAFGDLVIANAILRRIDRAVSPSFGQIIGNHLRELNETLAPSWPIIYFNHGENGVPSLFDVRKNGLVNAVFSAIRLRQALRNLTLDTDTSFIIDRSGLRERFMTNRIPTVSLRENAANIYQAYSLTLASLGFVMKETTASKHSRRGPLGIFPGSRVAKKNLSLNLIQNIIETSAQSSASPQLFLLEGERPDLERSGLEYILIPRQFSAMKRAVDSCCAVISADSMPAHLAEASGVPVFVLSPVPNAFWLPLSCYNQTHWCLFSDSGLRNQLSEYLQSLQ